ncbi:selenoprotein T [Arctopsyche grandis]|uniref:selenoprotein T n=1 Tax=Arctopsyche grandis TaxID=121162 RepID=UPI00406DA293
MSSATVVSKMQLRSGIGLCGVALVAMAMTMTMMLWTPVSADSASSLGPELTPPHTLGTRITMNILYCYSCGYRKVFEDYAGIIQQKYPEISVYGSNYEPPGVKMYLSRFIGVAKMLLILCILSNTQIFGIFNRAPPPWWTWCMENKLYACMMLFFLSNTIEGQLVSSGAFEISLNDIPVWSKLETGRIPHPPELFLIIDNTLNFSTDDTVKEGFVK